MLEMQSAVLGVWAHPDDEAYLSAGLMAQARAAGRRVVVATATWGEKGTDDPLRYPPQELARLRERELSASLSAVGVVEHRHLGYRDGECADADPAVAAEAVAALLREVRPAVVVTFGPDGMTGHPDHRAVSSWTTAAWHATGRRCRLWYATVTPEFHAEWGVVNERLGVWLDGPPPATPAAALAHQVVCDGPLLAAKDAALAAHATQTAGPRHALGDAFSRWWRTESFVAAT
jgi:LmbE family N-acetylglucosaminyl deacetylase